MKKQIHDALSQLITKRLEKHLSSKLDSQTCIEIYKDIFDTVLEVFRESRVDVSNEAVNLLSQMYYDSVKINAREDLDPNIFTSRAKIENVSTKELAMLASLFSGTPYGDIFVYSTKRRS